jgi:hypothetical protein
MYYKIPIYRFNGKFNFFVDIVYDDPTKKELEDYLNKKRLEE